MDAVLQHVDNRAEVRVAIGWHRHDDKISVLEEIRSTVRDLRRANNGACKRAPEHIDPRITFADIASGSENGDRATCFGHNGTSGNHEHGTR